MNQHQSTVAAPSSSVQDTRAHALSHQLMQLAGAGLIGLAILYGAGFAPMSALHNAAHDVRHSAVFPCH